MNFNEIKNFIMQEIDSYGEKVDLKRFRGMADALIKSSNLSCHEEDRVIHFTEMYYKRHLKKNIPMFKDFYDIDAAKFMIFDNKYQEWHTCKTCREFLYIRPGSFFEGPHYINDEKSGPLMYCIYSTQYSSEENICGIARYFAGNFSIHGQGYKSIYEFVKTHKNDLEVIFQTDFKNIFRYVASYIKHLKKKDKNKWNEFYDSWHYYC